MHRLSSPARRVAVAALLTGLLVSPAVARSTSVDELIATLRTASPAVRRAVAERLIRTGGEGLAATRAARDSERDPGLRRALDRIVLYQLAEKITPKLTREFESNLRFDGQFAEFAGEGPEIRRTLLTLIDDEATPLGLRVASCQALADVGDDADLPRLRQLWSDPLLAPILRDRIGLLLAILGDRFAVDRELGRLVGFVASLGWEEPAYIPVNARLAELYYQIRDYDQAVECYERILLAYGRRYDELIERAELSDDDRETLRQEFALYHYNAACSNTLKGDIEEAKELLRKAVELDSTHYSNVEKDGDFRALRAAPGFAEFRRELSRLVPAESF